MNTNKLEATALRARKSWGRKGKKGYYKAVATRADRRAGKATCRVEV